jgi:urea transporter
MHPSAQLLTIIGIPLLGIPACIIAFTALYYSLQAANNLKSDAKWPRFGGMARGSIILVPRSDFTQLGLWYRRRSFIMGFALVAWFFVILSYQFLAAWLTS